MTLLQLHSNWMESVGMFLTLMFLTFRVALVSVTRSLTTADSFRLSMVARTVYSGYVPALRSLGGVLF